MEEDNLDTKSDKVVPNEHQEEEDGVPRDFFDDFLKEDFMAGLDIVDEDDEEEKDKQKKQNENNQSEKTTSKFDLRNKLNKKSNEIDIRRDPKKTKRDIEKDKERCLKDKEKKIISEKLKIVETGLVPPGTEMEIELPELKSDKKVEIEQEEPRKKSLSLKKRSLTPKRRITKSPKRRRSPIRRSSPIRPNKLSPIRATKLSPIRRTSANKLSPIRRLNPIRRDRSLPRRSRDRSPLSPIRRIPRRDRSLPRRSRDRSPIRRSPIRISRRTSIDRSLRRSLDRKFRRSRSRSVDKYRYKHNKRSRTRSRSRSRKRDNDKKKSFLQEIADKLNDTTNRQYQMPPQYHLPVNYPVPVPVPPPVVQYQPQQYDKSFFIGNTDLINNSAVMPVITTNNYGNQVVDTNSNNKTKEDISKLFQDKKITLTEFLAITAKPEVYSASPESMKEKIKVISRCQEAIKLLGNSEKKFTGPLYLHNNNANPKILQEKYKSPLIKSVELKLPFTEIPKIEKYKNNFTENVNNLLKKLGLLKEEIILIEDDLTLIEDEDNKIPPPAPIFSINNQSTTTTTKLNKYIQTEGPKCKECERRKKIVYINAMSQCGIGDSISYSVSTQVNEADFQLTLPKNQSLASLTPAQLLARSAASTKINSRSIETDDFDLLFPKRINPRLPQSSRNVPAPSRGLSFEPPARGPVPNDKFNFNNYY